MLVASFNVENMFRRPTVLGDENWATHRADLEKFARFQTLLQKAVYSAADKVRIAGYLSDFGLAKTDDGPLVVLRRARGQLVTRGSAGLQVTAGGRGDWIGWIELKLEAVNEIATRHTARVIADIGADVVVVVEAEDRPALTRFNEDVFGPHQLATLAGASWVYGHVMLVDGNDNRGIDVGILARDGYTIESIASHVDDRDTGGNRIFSRDCAEYAVRTPGGDRVVVLANHFKSKGFGVPADNNARRLAQARRTAEIYQGLRARGERNVIVAGDLNDTPDSPPLAPLLAGTDLVDVSLSATTFDDGGRTGTFGTSKDKIDYLLCSPDITVHRGGIFRKGVWHGPHVKNPWAMYDSLTKPVEAASDHAAIWADISLA